MIKMIQGDSLDVMRGYADNQFDLVLTDPPYGIKEDGRRGTRRPEPYDKWKNPKPSIHKNYGWDDKRPTKQYFDEIIRVSKNQIIFGGNYFADYLPVRSGWIFWDKQVSGDFSHGEFIWTSFNIKARKYEHLWNGFRQMAGLVEKRLHPTQKPTRLIKWILQDYAKSGWTILDPFMGSGTTILACKDLGHDCTGIEINPDYVKIAQDRLKQEVLL